MILNLCSKKQSGVYFIWNDAKVNDTVTSIIYKVSFIIVKEKKNVPSLLDRVKICEKWKQIVFFLIMYFD